jgi:putative endonuclease
MAWIYLIRCSDGTLYVGRTNDLAVRIATHNEGRGGTYTARRRPVQLVYSEPHQTDETAAARERQIKRWTKAKKEALVGTRSADLKRLAISRQSPRHRGDRQD